MRSRPGGPTAPPKRLSNVALRCTRSQSNGINNGVPQLHGLLIGLFPLWRDATNAARRKGDPDWLLFLRTDRSDWIHTWPQLRLCPFKGILRVP